MASPAEPGVEICNCAALRQAARHVTQFYDRYLMPTGLRTSQFSILARVKRLQPVTMGPLAEAMGMDRTTLARNIRPLERAGLVAAREGEADRRHRVLCLTAAGQARHGAALTAWKQAQKDFENAFGRDRSARLRQELRATTAVAPADAAEPR